MTENNILTINESGRILIPADIRKKMGLVKGSSLVFHLEENKLVLESSAKAWQNIQGMFRDVRPGHSVSEELIRERHEEAEREGY